MLFNRQKFTHGHINTQIHHRHVHALERVEQMNKQNKQSKKKKDEDNVHAETITEETMGAQ